MDEESPVSKICFCNIIVLRPHAMLSKGSVDAAHHAVRLFNTFPKQFYISWKMHQAFITVGICIDCLKILYVWVPAISGGGNLAASKIRNLECPSYGLKDYGCGKFIRKIHCNLQIFLCLFLEKLNMPLNTPVTKALQVRFSFLL